YYKEDLSKVSIEHIRLEKYPSGREGETYVIPQDTMVVAWDAFTSLIHLNNIVVPASVRSFDYLSVCGGLRDSDKSLNIIFQHNTYPIDMCYCAFHNLPKGSKIIVKNNTVKNQFIEKKSYYNYDYTGNEDYVSVITNNTPCQSLTVDKTDVKIKVGESVTVVPTQSPTITTDNVGFTSSNKKIASVDEYNFGNITGISPGKATITVTSGNVKAIVNVEVICEHLHKKTVNAKVASCSAEGYSGDKICSDCGVILEKGTSTPKKAHTYKTYTTRSTTSAAGKITTKCSVCGVVKLTQTIARISSVKLSGTSYTYDGKVKTPSVTVKNASGKTLVKNTDYTVSYPSGRKNVGKYAVKVKFKGKYRGTKTLYFTIKPKATGISSLTAKSKGFTVKWFKRSTQTTGYQVQYSTSSKFTSPKTVTISKTGTTSKTISKLKAKKKYYVRVRTYKTVNGTKYYSSWSKAKYVTTKS
ncbi:MAG: Ig-like domain-containing protein, partial [Eubacteriales bacterium]|nr:Ig-like domain-containing protein [Eubacteriales bacterium]